LQSSDIPASLAARALKPSTSETDSGSTAGFLRRARKDRAGAIVVGGGNYTRVHAARFLRRCGVHLKWLVEIEPALAMSVGRAYGFESITTNLGEAARDAEAGIAVVAGYHSTHADYAILLLESGKKVLIEKPPVSSHQQLARLTPILAARPKCWAVGFNRRYAAGVDLLREELREQGHPVTVTCVIHEIRLPDSHWYFWPSQGGRVLGNLCHWIDLGGLLVGEASPVEIFVTPNQGSASRNPTGRYDEDVSVSVRYSDESLVNIVSSSRGDEMLGMHEWIQVRSGDLLATIDDFRATTISRRGRTIFANAGPRSRGHRAMYREIVANFLRDEEQRFSLRQLVLTSRLMLEVEEMLFQGIARRAVGGLEADGNCARREADWASAGR
jgi:predicted dehydrogenase